MGLIFVVKIAEWSVETFGELTDFNLIEPLELNSKLGKFYGEAAPKSSEKRAHQMSSEHASEYQNSYKPTHTAINRHLQDLGRDNLQEGLARPTQHKEIINRKNLFLPL